MTQALLDELEQAVDAKKRQRIMLEGQLQELGENVTRQTTKYETLTSDIAAMQEIRVDLQKDNQQLTEQIALKAEELLRLKGQRKPFQDLSDQIKTLTARKEVLERECGTLAERNPVMAKELEILEMDIRIKSTRVSELKADIESLTKDAQAIIDRRKEVEDQLVEIATAESDIRVLTERNERAVADLERFPNTIGYYVKGLQRLMDERNIKIDIMAELQRL